MKMLKYLQYEKYKSRKNKSKKKIRKCVCKHGRVRKFREEDRTRDGEN